mgnify:CR=1 FL=1
MSNNEYLQDIKEYYQHLDLEEHDGIIFPLNKDWKNIAVSVSGGADSALLCYLLSKIIHDKGLDICIHLITNVRMYTTRPWQKYDSLRVYHYLKNCFPTIQYYRHENYIAPELETGNIGQIIPHKGQLKGGDQISTFSYAMYICRTHYIDSWFAGKTLNPDKNFSGAPADRDFYYNGDFSEILHPYKGLYVCHPFLFKDKSWIMKQYKNLNVLTLLAETRSCEGDNNSAPEIFENLDFETYVPYQLVPKCKKCFWCLERQWGLDANNI